MKLLVSLALIFCSLGALAQNWAPFPLDETSEWRVNYGSYDGEGIWQNYQYDYVVAGTDSFAGKEFIRLEAGSGVRFIRQENGIYYTWGPGEEVLFDLNVEIGDTIDEFLVVDSIGMVDIGGVPCTKLYIVDFNEDPHWIIDGVGHSGGLFYPIYHEFTSGSVCYKENEVLLVFTDENSCDLLNSIKEEDESLLQITPNPSSGIFRIETPQKSIYRIYSAFGSLVKEEQLDGASEIDISSEPNGIYLITIESEKGIHSEKLVKQ